MAALVLKDEAGGSPDMLTVVVRVTTISQRVSIVQELVVLLTVRTRGLHGVPVQKPVSTAHVVDAPVSLQTLAAVVEAALALAHRLSAVAMEGTVDFQHLS